MRRKVHVFDDIERASHALRQIQIYLDEASIGPAALSLKYDDSGTDELLVCLCLIILIYALCQPAYEVVTIDAHAEVVRVRRRNLLGYACLDLAVAVENVDQLTVTEHALVHDLLTYEPQNGHLEDCRTAAGVSASRGCRFTTTSSIDTVDHRIRATVGITRPPRGQPEVRPGAASTWIGVWLQVRRLCRFEEGRGRGERRPPQVRAARY